jgi:nitrogen fixation NifU-like protein
MRNREERGGTSPRGARERIDMDTYTQKVLEHFQNPKNAGEIADADGVGEVGNPTCGDMMRITIKVDDGRLSDIKWKTLGCGAAIATSSVMTELAKGKTIDEALATITRDNVAAALDGLPPAKMHCSNLAADGLRAAIDDYLKKHPATTGEKAD